MFLHQTFSSAESAFVLRLAQRPPGFTSVSIVLLLLAWLASPSQAAAGEPGPPINFTAEQPEGRNEVVLDWEEPLDNGGSDIVSYTIRRGINGGNFTPLVTVEDSEYTDLITLADTEGSEGANLRYRVRARNSDGDRGALTRVRRVNFILRVSPSTPPGAPTGLEASGDVGQIRLIWTAPTDNGGSAIEGYRIERGNVTGDCSDNPTFEELVENTRNTDVSHTDSGLGAGETWCYRVSAINTVNTGAASDEASARTLVPPGPPVGLMATALVGGTTIQLGWTRPVEREGDASINGYFVQHSPDGTDGSWVDSPEGTVNVNGYLHKNLPKGETVHYRVYTESAAGRSAPSISIMGTTLTTAPGAPTDLRATGGNGQISLEWTMPVDTGGVAITGYRIERALGDCSGTPIFTERVANTASTNSRYPDTGLTAGETWCYQVSAINGVDTGAASDPPASATAEAPDTAPGFGSETITDQQWRIGGAVMLQLPAATGGEGTLRYRLTPALPNGVTLSGAPACDPGCSISGTPAGMSAVREDVTYTWRADDSDANTADGDAALLTFDITVAAVVPGAPTNLVATGGSRQITLTWDEPVSDGGDEIIGYRIEQSEAEYYTYYNFDWHPRHYANWTDLVTDTGNTDTKYTHTDLYGRHAFRYRVSAINSSGPGKHSNMDDAITDRPTPPSPPRNLTATGIVGGVELRWMPPEDHGGSRSIYYRIQRSPNGSTNWAHTPYPYADFGSTSYVDVFGVMPLQTYHYRVVAVGSGGDGRPSNTEVGTLQAAGAPQAPTNFSASGRSGKIQLQWMRPLNTGGIPITSYKIQYHPGSCDTGNFDLLKETDGAGSLYSYKGSSHTGLPEGATYCYRIIAVNLKGDSPPSDERDATTWVSPGAPTDLRVTYNNAGWISLNWKAPVDNGDFDIKYYRIERSLNGSTGWAYLGSESAPSTAHTDFSPLTPHTYYYRVNAVSRAGTGASSNKDHATMSTALAPGAPTDVIATSDHQQISLTWTPPENRGGAVITGYEIKSRSGSCDSGEFSGPGVISEDTTYTHDGLDVGVTHCYQVSAINSVETGTPSNSVESTTRRLVPSAPTGLTATYNGRLRQVVLEWNAPVCDGGSAVIGYRIEHSRTWGRWTDLEENTNSSDPVHTDSVMYHGGAKQYRVYAINGVGESPVSDLVNVYLRYEPESSSRTSRSRARSTAPTPTVKKPGAPLALQATGAAGQVALSWTEPEEDGGAAVTGYRVQRSDTGREGSWTNRDADTESTDTRYTDDSLASGRTFHYRVAAINSVGLGAWSESARAVTTLSPEEILSSRGNLRGFGGSHAGNTLSSLAGRLGRSALGQQSRRVSIGGQDMSAFASFRKGDDEEGRPDAKQAMESVMGLLGVRLPESGELAQGLAAPGAASPAAGFSMGVLPADGSVRAKPALGVASRIDSNREDALLDEGLTIRSRSAQELIAGSSFEIPLTGTGNGFVDEAGQAAGGWTVWGKAALSEFDGGDSQGANQETLSAYMGMDFQGGGNWLMGVALGSSANDAMDSDEWEFDLLSVTPYAQWSPTPKFNVWGLVSVGRGEAGLERKDSDGLHADLETRMAALGMENVLYQRGRSEFSVKMDGFMVNSTLGATETFPEIKSGEHRARLMLEGKHALNEGGKVPTQFSLDVAARMDGSDIEESSYLELGTGFEGRYAPLGLHLGVNGRFLVAQSEQDHEEWGASLTASFDPGVRGDGISLSLESNLGVSASRARDIWSDRKMRVRRSGFSHARSSFDVELAYGTDLLSKRLRLEPFGEFGFVDAGLSDLRFGARINVGDWGVLNGIGPLLDNMDIEFFSERENLRSQDPEHRFGVEVEIAF